MLSAERREQAKKQWVELFDTVYDKCKSFFMNDNEYIIVDKNGMLMFDASGNRYEMRMVEPGGICDCAGCGKSLDMENDAFGRYIFHNDFGQNYDYFLCDKCAMDVIGVVRRLREYQKKER